MTIADTPLAEIEASYKYFQVPANTPTILATTERSAYAWRHMSNYYHTEQVLQDGPVRDLQKNEDPAIGKIVVSFADGTRRTVDDHFAASSMSAMLVVRAGEVVYERYKTMRPFDKHVWFSCSKTIVGTMIALLEHEGRLDIAQPVTDHLPALAGSVWDTVTIEQALDMATGLDSTEHEEPDARTNPARGWYRWAVSIGLFAPTDRPVEAPVDVLRGMTRRKPPHSAFEYNSINTYVCQMIVETLTGLPLAELFGERVWRRMGTQGDGYLVLDRQGRAMGFGFMNSTLRDLARYGMSFTRNDAARGGGILPEAVLQKVHSGLRSEMFDKGAFGSSLARDFPLSGIANRYQWDLVTPDGDQFKAGLAGQGLYVSAPQDSVVVFFSTGSQRDEALGAWTARTITQTFR